MWVRKKVPYAGVLLILVALASAGCAAGPRLGGEEEAAAASSPAAADSPHATGGPSTGASGGREPSGSAHPSLTVPPLPSTKDLGIVEGADLSWPQCPKGMGIKQRRTEGQPMPLSSARYAVIGLTNGPAFHPNPCLSSQVGWAKAHHLMTSAYSVISYPTAVAELDHAAVGPGNPATHEGRLTNVGYAQAQYNVSTMKDAGLETPAIWLDVEPVTIWEWSHDRNANAAVVRGAVKAYQDAGYQVGIYSLESLWTRIVGDLDLDLPEWRPAGESSRQAALKRCGRDWSFNAGDGVLVQWLDGHRDRNLTCPGESAYLGLWFHQY